MTGDKQHFERLIAGVIDWNYGICDHFLRSDLLRGLRENLLSYHTNGAMHPAGIGRHFDYTKNVEVRGDVIKWIDENTKDPIERELLLIIDRFTNYLNATCYTRINQYELHYAWYEAGSFYKRHLDQFKSHRGRKFSLVLYLNEKWQESDGGNLRLYMEDGEEDVYPEGGRAVFFKSDEVEHEVMVAPNRPRMSIAGWLKSV